MSEDFDFRGFFAGLRDAPGIVRSGNVHVDVPGTVERRVACSDGLCQRGLRGRALVGKTCCTTLRVPVERLDVRRIERVLPEVRKIRDVGDAIDRAGGFWHEDEGSLWLRGRPSGACVFLSAPRGGPALCTLHEWAASRGMDHRKVKPEMCCLYPLYLVMWGDTVCVTSYGSRLWRELEPEEGDDLPTFACLNPRPGEGRPLLVEQQDELEARIGRGRWRAALRKLRSLGHPV